MSVPPVLRPKNEKSVGSSAEAPLPLMALKSRWTGVLPWAAAAIALVLGFTAGVLVMRHRHEGQKIVAVVNTTNITDDALYARLQTAAGQQVMHKMVEEELQLQFAKSQGHEVTQAQVDDKYKTISKNPQFLPALQASGMSLADYKRSLSVKLALANVLTAGVKVSDAEIRDFYNKQSDPKNPQAQFYMPATVTLSVIATTNSKAAEAALAELNTNTPFPLVASEYSVDPSKDKGGRLVPLQQGRSPLSQNPALEAAVFNLKVGQLSKPMPFNKGYWIFRCEEKSPGKVMPFSEHVEEARLGAAIIKGTKENGVKIEQKFQAFEAGSNLTAFWPQYQRAVTGR